MQEDYLLIAVDAEQKFAIRFISLEHAVRESVALHRVQGEMVNVLSQHLIASVLLGSRSDEQESNLYKLSLAPSQITLNCEVSPHGPFRSAIFPPEKRNDDISDFSGMFKVRSAFLF